MNMAALEELSNEISARMDELQLGIMPDIPEDEDEQEVPETEAEEDFQQHEG